MVDKVCHTCAYYALGANNQNWCLALVLRRNNVTGLHTYYSCETARKRKPRYSPSPGEWCGESGRLWKAKDDNHTKDRIQRIAELLVAKAGFNDEDAFSLANEITEIK